MDSKIASIRKQFTPFTIFNLGYPRKRKKKRKKREFSGISS
jgi:penicillin-binding protein-related factor A (putative recombinase)